MLLPRKTFESRNGLKRHFDVIEQFETIEQCRMPTCAHANSQATRESWLRLVSVGAFCFRSERGGYVANVSCNDALLPGAPKAGHWK